MNGGGATGADLSVGTQTQRCAVGGGATGADMVNTSILRTQRAICTRVTFTSPYVKEKYDIWYIYLTIVLNQFVSNNRVLVC
jgi:hypothetical protein